MITLRFFTFCSILTHHAVFLRPSAVVNNIFVLIDFLPSALKKKTTSLGANALLNHDDESKNCVGVSKCEWITTKINF